MSDDDTFYTPNRPPAPPRTLQPGEPGQGRLPVPA